MIQEVTSSFAGDTDDDSNSPANLMVAQNDDDDAEPSNANQQSPDSPSVSLTNSSKSKENFTSSGKKASSVVPSKDNDVCTGAPSTSSISSNRSIGK